MQTVPATTAIPLDPAIAALSIPQRMLAVMDRNRLQGQPTTDDDFRQAEETCDLTDAQLQAHIGEAKRLINPRTVRQEQPVRPLNPLSEPTYRKQRTDALARQALGLMPTRQAICDDLMHRGASKAELDVIFDDVMREAGYLFAQVR